MPFLYLIDSIYFLYCTTSFEHDFCQLEALTWPLSFITLTLHRVLKIPFFHVECFFLSPSPDLSPISDFQFSSFIFFLLLSASNMLTTTRGVIHNRHLSYSPVPVLVP